MLAILWGLAAFAIFNTSLSIIVVLGISVLVLVIRHLADWLPYVLGVIVGVLFALLAGIALPETALLIVVLGSVLF